MELSDREKEIIYFALSRQLDSDILTAKEFKEIDDLRDQFYTGEDLPTY